MKIVSDYMKIVSDYKCGSCTLYIVLFVVFLVTSVIISVVLICCDASAVMINCI